MNEHIQLSAELRDADEEGERIAILLRPGGTAAWHIAHGMYRVGDDALEVDTRDVQKRGAAPDDVTEYTTVIPYASLMWARTYRRT